MRKQQWKVCRGWPLPYGVTTGDGWVNISIFADDIPTIEIWDDVGKRLSVDMEPYSFPGSVYAVRIEGEWPEHWKYRLKVKDDYMADAWQMGKSRRSLSDERFCGVDMTGFDWQEDRPPHIPYNKLYMYKLHVKGFTRHASSKVRSKGMIGGVTEKLAYMKDLGMNGIELMPVYAFDPMVTDRASQTTRVNYWGYGEGCFKRVHPEYGTMDDLRVLVRQAHRMDMEIYLELLFPDHMPDPEKVDILRFWVLNAHVDGFHLSHDTSPVDMILNDPILSDVKIFTEGFSGAERLKEERTAVCHNGYLEAGRRFLRGDRDSCGGWMGQMLERRRAGGMIRYLAVNNGFTLMDLVSYNEKHNEANGENNRDGAPDNLSYNCGVEGPSRKKAVVSLRTRQLKNAWILALFNQGTPLIYAGDEFGNSQEGNNNAWCQDNETSWLNWQLLKNKKWLWAFAKRMIALRKSEPIFAPDRPFKMADVDGLGYPDFSFHGKQPWFVEEGQSKNCVGCMYTGKNEDDTLKAYYIAYNMSDRMEQFHLPSLPEGMTWTILEDTSGEGDGQGPDPDGGWLLESHSIVIFKAVRGL